MSSKNNTKTYERSSVAMGVPRNVLRTLLADTRGYRPLTLKYNISLALGDKLNYRLWEHIGFVFPPLVYKMTIAIDSKRYYEEFLTVIAVLKFFIGYQSLGHTRPFSMFQLMYDVSRRLNYISVLDQPIDNSRYKRTDFDVSCANIIHGVAGYFDVVLYKDIMISE